MSLIRAFKADVNLEHISPFVEIIWSLEMCRWFLLWMIFVGPCELADISQVFFFIHCRGYYRTLYLLCLEISESDSTYIYSRTFCVDGRIYSFWMYYMYFEFSLGLHDRHARIISDNVDGSTLEYIVD